MAAKGAVTIAAAVFTTTVAVPTTAAARPYAGQPQPWQPAPCPQCPPPCGPPKADEAGASTSATRTRLPNTAVLVRPIASPPSVLAEPTNPTGEDASTSGNETQR